MNWLLRNIFYGLNEGLLLIKLKYESSSVSNLYATPPSNLVINSSLNHLHGVLFLNVSVSVDMFSFFPVTLCILLKKTWTMIINVTTQETSALFLLWPFHSYALRYPPFEAIVLSWFSSGFQFRNVSPAKMPYMQDWYVQESTELQNIYVINNLKFVSYVASTIHNWHWWRDFLLVFTY